MKDRLRYKSNDTEYENRKFRIISLKNLHLKLFKKGYHFYPFITFQIIVDGKTVYVTRMTITIS